MLIHISKEKKTYPELVLRVGCEFLDHTGEELFGLYLRSFRPFLSFCHSELDLVLFNGCPSVIGRSFPFEGSGGGVEVGHLAIRRLTRLCKKESFQLKGHIWRIQKFLLISDGIMIARISKILKLNRLLWKCAPRSMQVVLYVGHDHKTLWKR